MKCKGLRESGGQQEFTGLVIDAATGLIKVPQRRIWRIRLSIVYVLRRGWATGDQIRAIASDFTWAVLVRRELLSIPHACFTFMQRAGARSWKLKSAVRRELAAMTALVCFAWANTRRQPSDLAIASDAAGGSGGEDFGGYGVDSSTASLAAARCAMAHSERWRFDVDDELTMRGSGRSPWLWIRMPPLCLSCMLLSRLRSRSLRARGAPMLKKPGGTSSSFSKSQIGSCERAVVFAHSDSISRLEAICSSHF